MGSTGPDVHGARDWKGRGPASKCVSSSNGPAKNTSSAGHKQNLGANSGSSLGSLGLPDLADSPLTEFLTCCLKNIWEDCF